MSVVTPFYNTEDHLAECIESVMRSTYQNWEYVLVNNCSTDGSVEVVERYVDQDSRLRLIHNREFLSQVENYNRAIRQISPSSKYCKIVQADDWIYDSCLESMVRVAEESPNVTLVGSYSYYEPLPIYGDHAYIGHVGLPYSREIFSGREILRRYLLERRSFFGSPTAVMFTSDRVRAKDDFFDLQSPFEDDEACFEALLAGDFAFVHQVLTFNRREPGSFWWRRSAWNADALNLVILGHRFGGALLNEVEHHRLVRRARSDHHRCLADAILSRRPRSYWQFHSEGLSLVNERIRKRSVAWQLIRSFVETVTCPKAIAGRAVRALRSRLWSPRSSKASEDQ